MTTSDVSFAWEPLIAAQDGGIARLVERHWREVGRHRKEMPLAVDWGKYQELEDAGILRLLTARRGEKLIGYNSLMIMPHIHYSTTTHAICDAIYVLPEERKGRTGLVLIDRAEKDIATWASPKWARVMYHDRSGVEALKKLLLRRGYGLADLGYDKMVRA